LTRQASLQDLLHRMLDMSDADVSTLEAAVNSAGGQDRTLMSTVVGSANYGLWRALTDLGWLREDRSLPTEGLDALRVFAINPNSVPDLKHLLAEFRHRKQHRKMAEIYETFCVPFARQLVERINGNGGDHADVGLLMGLTLARALHQCCDPKSYDVAAQQVAEIAKKRLAQEVAQLKKMQ
jgi:hypothetical protein